MDFVDRFQEGASDAMTNPVSQAMCDTFANLSGDDAPLHTDEDSARRNGFDGTLVHGAILFLLPSCMIGIRYSGPSSLWLKYDISFRNPCYARSMLRFHDVVIQQSEATPSIAMSVDITDDRERQIATDKTVHKVP